MKSRVRILDDRPGAPKIEGNRLTVMDVFYYLHRGHGWDVIHWAMPSLSRDEFDAVVEYVDKHREKLVEMDNWIEERNRRGIAEQEAKGIRPIDFSIPLEERIEKMRARVREHEAERAAKECSRCFIVG